MVRYLRYLAIAVSLIVFGTMAALWVRSYWRNEWVQGPLPRSYNFNGGSNHGRLSLTVWPSSLSISGVQWRFHSVVDSGQNSKDALGSPFKFRLDFSNASYLHVPHGALVMIAGLLAAALAVGRFRLRTLMVVMTIVAMVLLLLQIGPERVKLRKQPPPWLQERGYVQDVS